MLYIIIKNHGQTPLPTLVTAQEAQELYNKVMGTNEFNMERDFKPGSYLDKDHKPFLWIATNQNDALAKQLDHFLTIALDRLKNQNDTTHLVNYGKALKHKLQFTGLV